MKFALQMAQAFGKKQGLCICSHHSLILGAEVHGVNIFGTAGLQLQSIAITSSATATTQITQAGHWRVQVVSASPSQPGRLRKYCECKRPHVF